MQNRKNAFVAIYTLELQDLKEHLHNQIVDYSRKYNEGEISNYVFKENSALLENEICGLDYFLELLNKVDLSAISSVEELRDIIKESNETSCATEGIAHPTAMLANRKADRITAYLRESEKLDEEFFSYINLRKKS